VRDGTWIATDNPLVILGDRAAGILEVRVMMLGNLADGGFRLDRKSVV
jgi:hypothetical protein